MAFNFRISHNSFPCISISRVVCWQWGGKGIPEGWCGSELQCRCMLRRAVGGRETGSSTRCTTLSALRIGPLSYTHIHTDSHFVTFCYSDRTHRELHADTQSLTIVISLTMHSGLKRNQKIIFYSDVNNCTTITCLTIILVSADYITQLFKHV